MKTADLLDLATVPGSHGQSSLAERRLLTAVLRQAMEDMTDYRFATDPNARLIRDAAVGWIFSTANEEADDHLSFVRTCDLLGLDPSYVRRLVRTLAKVAPLPHPGARAA